MPKYTKTDLALEIEHLKKQLREREREREQNCGAVDFDCGF
jgi:hypothetical protein